MSTYWIVGETEAQMRAVRDGMKRAKGRDVTFSDVIEALLEMSHKQLVERGWIDEQQ